MHMTIIVLRSAHRAMVLCEVKKCMACPHVSDGGTASSMEGNCEYMTKQSRTSGKGCSSNLGVGRGANNSSP